MDPFNIKIFISFFVLSVSCCWGFSYTDCGKKDTSIINLENLDIAPSPIKLPGFVNVSAKVTLLRDLSKEAKLEMTIIRKLQFGIFQRDIVLPCLGDTGSCTKDLCEFVKQNEERLCPFMPEGIECECPFKAMLYQREGMIVPMPDFGPVINLLISGNYVFRFRLIHERKELVCVKLHLNLTG